MRITRSCVSLRSSLPTQNAQETNRPVAPSADGFFATIRASLYASLSSTSAVNRSDDVVSSAASRLAVGFFVFPLVATVPSPDVKYVIIKLRFGFQNNQELAGSSMRLRRPLPAVQGDTLHIVGVGDNRIGKVLPIRILCVGDEDRSLSPLTTKIKFAVFYFIAFKFSLPFRTIHHRYRLLQNSPRRLDPLEPVQSPCQLWLTSNINDLG